MSRWPFHFATTSDDPEEERLPELGLVLGRLARRVPSRDATSVAARRQRVKQIICRKGRVCSGTLSCPCVAEDNRS